MRRLLVLDHLDIGESSSSEDGASRLSAERQDEKQLLLEKLSNSNVYVMLINRSTETCYHSGRLAVDYLKSIGLENVLTEGSSGTWLDYFTCRMQYNPVSITTYLDGLKPSIESRTNRKVALSEAIRLLFNSLWQNVPDAFFIPAAGHEQEKATIECMNGASAALNALQAIHSSVFGAVFSIPFGIFDPEWLTFAFQLSIDQVGETFASRWPSASEALGFAKKAWIRSGWIEEFDLSLPGGGSKQYMRSHPLFTNTLRILLNTQRDRLFRVTYEESWRGFASFYYSKALQLMPSNRLSEEESNLVHVEIAAGTPWQLNTHAELSKSQLVTVQAEAANYLQSFAMLLKIERLWQAAIVLRLLWLVAERSTTLALSVDHLTPASSMFFKAVEAAFKNKKFSRKKYSRKEKRLLLSYVNLFYIELAIFHMEKNPRLAADYARDALVYLMRYRDKASYWTADVKQNIIHLLLLRACACSQTGRNFDQAEAARDLAAKFLKSLLGAVASASVADRGSATSTSTEETSGTTNHILLAMAAVAAHLSELAYNQASGQQDLLESLRRETDRSVEQVVALLQPPLQGEARDLSLIIFGLLGQLCGRFCLPDLDVFLESIKALDNGGQLSLIRSTLESLSEAQRYGARADEHRCQIELAEIAIHLKDWVAAYDHIHSVITLSDAFIGGRTPYNTVRDRTLRFTRYGIVHLRLNMLTNALFCFNVALRDTQSQGWPDKSSPYDLVNTNTPKKLVNAALFLSRMSLLQFYRDSDALTLDEFYELDDIVQSLILREIRARWPKCKVDSVASSEKLRRWFEVITSDDGLISLVPAYRRETLLEEAIGSLGYKFRLRLLQRFGIKSNARTRLEVRKVQKWQQQQDLQEKSDLDLKPLAKNIMLYCAGLAPSEQEAEEPLQRQLEYILLHGGLMA